MEQKTPAVFHSGFVAVMGHPNVGKSTLINRFLQQKIAAVSPRPQTTRKRQLGILTTDSAQIIFMDTPGMHRPRHKLGHYMNQQVNEALKDADLILFIVDASLPPTEEDQMLAELIQDEKRQNMTLLVLNKMDLLKAEQLEERQRQFEQLLPGCTSMAISASRGDHCDELLNMITARLPEGPAYFPEDQITDFYERDIAADLIREAALNHLRDEVPHGIAVRIDEYKERSEGTAYIAATLLLEREAHKPIVIGKNGAMLKKIGTSARMEIENLIGRKAFLELRVKVDKDWRDDEDALRRLGFAVTTQKGKKHGKQAVRI